MKFKFAVFTLSLLMVLTMSTGAFAQATFQVSAGATQGRMNGHTEPAGGITLAVTSGSIGTATGDNGTVLIDYGVPITNASDTADNAIEVTICDELDGASNMEIEGNTITLTVTDKIKCSVDDKSNSIDLEGVQLSLVGSGLSSVQASVTSTGDVRLLGGATTVTVMNSVVDELTDEGLDVAETLTLIRHTGKVDTDSESKFKLLIMENTVRSFDNAQINLEFSGIPDGVEVTLEAWAATAEDLEDEDFVLDQTLKLNKSGDQNTTDTMYAALDINTAGNRIAFVDAEDNEASVLTTFTPDAKNDEDTDADETTVKGGMLTAGRDVVIVFGSIDLGGDDNLEELFPLNLDIQVTVDVGPIGVAKPKGDQITTIPRFSSDKTTAVTVIDSSSAQITMKVAYVLSEGLYDTGIAVSNMTKDQAGAVHFALYMNGQELTHSTSMMAPQTTMTMLLSEVLTAADHTGSFRGYMVITVDFTEADASVFVSDFAGFTSASAVYQKRN